MVQKKGRKAKRKAAAPAATGPLMSVPAGGRHYLNKGSRASYEAVKRGDLLVIKIGNRLMVPVAAMERRLEDLADRALEAARARDRAAR